MTEALCEFSGFNNKGRRYGLICIFSSFWFVNYRKINLSARVLFRLGDGYTVGERHKKIGGARKLIKLKSQILTMP